MSFNNSCSLAGLANMLLRHGIDTEDEEIAREMGLQYWIEYDASENTYRTGSMLQQAAWYDLYLKPRGFRFLEQSIDKADVLDELLPGDMLGMHREHGGKHAYVYLGEDQGRYMFLNPHREDAPEEDVLSCTEAQCMERLEDTVVNGRLVPCPPQPVDRTQIREKSLHTLRRYREDLSAFLKEHKDAASWRAAQNTLFRPLLMDHLTMVSLCGEHEQLHRLQTLQRQFIQGLRAAEGETPCLDGDLVDQAIAHWQNTLETIKETR